MQRLQWLVLTVVAVGSLMASRPAGAQAFSTFLLIPGVPGSSVDDRHKNWIDVLSLSQGLAATDGKRLTVACDLTVVKSLDVAGPLLWAAAATGQVFPEMTIEVARAGETRQVFYVIRLGNTRIASITTNVNTESLPVEQLGLAPGTATLEIKEQKADGSLGATITRDITCAN